MQKKIQHLKTQLKEWNQNVFGRIEHRKTEILREKQWFDREAENRILSESEMVLKAGTQWNWMK